MLKKILVADLVTCVLKCTVSTNSYVAEAEKR